MKKEDFLEKKELANQANLKAFIQDNPHILDPRKAIVELNDNYDKVIYSVRKKKK